MALRMISLWWRFGFLKRGNALVLMILCLKVSWFGTRTEVLWKTSLGRTMA